MMHLCQLLIKLRVKSVEQHEATRSVLSGYATSPKAIFHGRLQCARRDVGAQVEEGLDGEALARAAVAVVTDCEPTGLSAEGLIERRAVQVLEGRVHVAQRRVE